MIGFLIEGGLDLSWFENLWGRRLILFGSDDCFDGEVFVMWWRFKWCCGCNRLFGFIIRWWSEVKCFVVFRLMLMICGNGSVLKFWMVDWIKYFLFVMKVVLDFINVVMSDVFFDLFLLIISMILLVYWRVFVWRMLKFLFFKNWIKSLCMVFISILFGYGVWDE